MAPTSRRVWLSVAITFAVVLSVAADAHLAPDDLLPFTATSGVLLSESIKSGARALLQNARVRNAENPVATAVKQAMTPATLDAAVAADAAQLKLMKHGDKTATKRASLRYYWTFACIEDVKLSAAEVAADEMAATRDNEQFVAAGVVDTRNRLIKVSCVFRATSSKACAAYLLIAAARRLHCMRHASTSSATSPL